MGCADRAIIAPLPLPRALLHGAYTFGNWATERLEFGKVPGIQCHTRFPWASLKTSDRRMAFAAEYDERDPAVTEQRVRWMEEAGVAYLVYQVEWSHAHTRLTNMPPWALPFPGAPLLMGHCPDNHAALDTTVKFCIDLWDVLAGTEATHWNELKSLGWTRAEIEESWRMFARTIAVRYMTKATYLTMDGGRPVLFKGYAETLSFYEREFGVSPERIVQILREEVRTVTGKELYLIATATDESAWPSLKGWGFNALTHYGLISAAGWQGAVSAYRHWWAKGLAFAKASGLDYWIPTSVGYDARAWPDSAQAVCIPTPAEFTEHLTEAQQLAQDNYAVTRGMLCCYALNELGEGGVLEPMQRGQLHDGDTMLQAFKQTA